MPAMAPDPDPRDGPEREEVVWARRVAGSWLELERWLEPSRDALTEEVARLRARRTAAEASAPPVTDGRAEAELAAVLASRSWRLTSPLRDLFRLLRGSRDRA